MNLLLLKGITTKPLDGIIFEKTVLLEFNRFAGIEGVRNKEESFIDCLRLRD
jgi:hypothetical protein